MRYICKNNKELLYIINKLNLRLSVILKNILKCDDINYLSIFYPDLSSIKNYTYCGNICESCNMLCNVEKEKRENKIFVKTLILEDKLKRILK